MYINLNILRDSGLNNVIKKLSKPLQKNVINALVVRTE